MPRSAVAPEGVETATQLYELALRYWSDGRHDDAIRVGEASAALLKEICPGSPLLVDVLGMLVSARAEPSPGPSGRR